MDRYTERVYRLLISSPIDILKEFSSGLTLLLLIIFMDIFLLRIGFSLVAFILVAAFVIYIYFNRLDVNYTKRFLPEVETVVPEREEVFDYFESTKEQTAAFSFNDRLEDIFRTGSSEALINTLATRHLQKLDEL